MDTKIKDEQKRVRYRTKSKTIEAEQFIIDEKPWPKEVIQTSIDLFVVDISSPSASRKVHEIISNSNWILIHPNGQKEVKSNSEFQHDYASIEEEYAEKIEKQNDLLTLGLLQEKNKVAKLLEACKYLLRVIRREELRGGISSNEAVDFAKSVIELAEKG